MSRPRICASIISSDLSVIKNIEDQVELFEIRIDLIGGNWREVAVFLNKPWVACNRCVSEGGSWLGTETGRIKELLSAIELGASIVDVELDTPNLKEIVKLVKMKAKCLISFHHPSNMLALDEMKHIVNKQLDSGADICKVVVTAKKFKDNLTVMQLISEFANRRIISFAMGNLGYVSRVFCPLVGGDFVYASMEHGKESAPGQITVAELRRIYELEYRTV